jgi:hypothetical protein
MRIGLGFGFILLLATSLCAQVGTMGSVVHPAGGAGTPGVTRSLGSVVNPAQGGTRVISTGGRRGTPSRAGTVYLYPVYVGGGYYTPYITQDSPMGAAPVAPADSVLPPPAQQPVTPVIINYNYNYPVEVPPPPHAGNMVQVQAPVEDASAPETSHYLIAFQDHTIYAATAYWVDGDTLHYFTAGNVHNQASLTLVDRDFTERLNKEAGVEVKLPAPSK